MTTHSYYLYDDELVPDANYTGFAFGTPAPFVDGQVDLDCCPPLLSVAECNGFLLGHGGYEVSWATGVFVSGTTFGGWSRTIECRPERVRQAVPGMPDYWPRSFYVDLDAPCTGVGGINGVGFAFTCPRTYRLDGAYDQFGSGGLRKKLLSDGAGCTSAASISRYGQTLYWLGADGFYASNGVDVACVSKNMRTRFSGRTCSSAVSDPAGHRILWVLDTGTFVCYPAMGLDPSNRCFVEWGGLSFSGACFMADGVSLYRGCLNGTFAAHQNPSTGAKYAGDFGFPYEASFQTPFVGFGDPISVKRQPRVDVLVDTGGGSFNVHLHSYKDSQSTCSVPEPIEVNPALTGSEGVFLATRSVVPFKRYMPSSDLHCHSRSMRMAVRGPKLSTLPVSLVYVDKVSSNHNFTLMMSGSDVGYFLRSSDGTVAELTLNNDDQFILCTPASRRTGVPIYLARTDGSVRLVSVGDDEHFLFETTSVTTPVSVYLTRPDGITRQLCLDNDDQLSLRDAYVARPVGVVVGSLIYLNNLPLPLEVTAVSTDTISIGDDISLAGYVAGDIVSDWSVHGVIPVGVGIRGLVLHGVGSSDNLQGGES